MNIEKALKQSEDSLQAKCYQWFHNEHELKGSGFMFAVPNGGSRNKIEAMKLKATGVRSGVSDCIILLNKEILFVEFKSEKGKQSEEQKAFQTLILLLGYKHYYIVNNFEQFKYLINTFVK